MIASHIEKWELRVENWKFDKSEFEIKKRALNNQTLVSRAHSK
jgi:hypothetical protein